MKTIRDGSENKPQIAGFVRLQDPVVFFLCYSVMTYSLCYEPF